MKSQDDLMCGLTFLGLNVDEARAVARCVILVAFAEHEDLYYVGRQAQVAAIDLCARLDIEAPDWWQETRAGG